MRYRLNEQKLQQYKKALRLEECFSDPDSLPITLAEFDEGETLYPAESHLQHLIFVAEGRIRIHYISEAGQQFVITCEDAPAFLGDVEFLEDIPSVNHVEAETDLTCLLLPMEQCRVLLKDDLLFHKFLCRNLVQKLIGSNEERQNQHSPLIQKLSSYLLLLFQSDKELPPLQQVSELMDCSYRHLLRTLKELCRLGALEQPKKGRYLLKDPALLKELAK